MGKQGVKPFSWIQKHGTCCIRLPMFENGNVTDGRFNPLVNKERGRIPNHMDMIRDIAEMKDPKTGLKKTVRIMFQDGKMVALDREIAENLKKLGAKFVGYFIHPLY